MKTQTDTWTIEEATTDLREVVRRALDDQPQVVVRGGRDDADAVVVIARTAYERLTAPKAQSGRELLAFFQNSPLAEAIRDGVLTPEDICPPRDIEPERPVDLGE